MTVQVFKKLFSCLGGKIANGRAGVKGDAVILDEVGRYLQIVDVVDADGADGSPR